MSEAQQDKPADAWGQPISEERQAELQGYLDKWEAETDHGKRKGPLQSKHLSGSDLAWLFSLRSYAYANGHPALHLERADLREAHLEGANLKGVHLEGADLADAHLDNANLFGCYLSDADLAGASLRGANLASARLERCKFGGSYHTIVLPPTSPEEQEARWSAEIEAHLEGAELTGAHLETLYVNTL